MKIQHAEFQISAQDLETCPYSTLPEFAFIGRSNVGKSSLINMLTGQKGLAKVSATPGHTRLINFFLINKKWHIVDQAMDLPKFIKKNAMAFTTASSNTSPAAKGSPA
jgi:GTP-binding protein